MKSFLILAILLFAFLGGCQYNKNGELSQVEFPETVYEDSESTAIEEAPPVEEVCETCEETSPPENYRFTISLPENWGALEQNINYGEITKYTWTSLEDPERYLAIRVIPTARRSEDAQIDYPQTLFAENEDYGFYYFSGGPHPGAGGTDPKYFEIESEVNQALETFKLL